MKPLKGKHALVTGGGSGIGAEIATTLANAGARVTITGRSAEKLSSVAEQNRLITTVTGDVTNEKSLKEVFAKAREQHGALDIVIANAGSAKSSKFETTTYDQWQHMLNANLTSVFLTFKMALPEFKQQQSGRLISIASTASLKGYEYVSAYCAAKHGVIGLTRSLALETAGDQITVNAICPGFTETPMLQNSIDNIVDKTGNSQEQARAFLSKNNPMKRFIQPHEVATTALWLSGPGAESITGQAISVSGGETW